VIETTFTWTKHLSYYFLLTGFYLYLKFWQENYRSYLYLSALFIGGAILTHYSVVPYVGMMFIDFLIRVFLSRKIKLKFLISWISIVILFCLTWFGWASINFGIYQTFLGNTSYQWQKNLTLSQRLGKDISNLKKSVLPVLSRQYLILINKQKNPLVILYDGSYALYANTLSGQISITLSLLLLICFGKYLINKIKHRATLSINLKKLIINTNLTPILVIGGGGILGIFSIPNLETTGFAQLTLIPVSLYLICLAVTKIIEMSHNKKYRLVKLIIIGLSIEAVFGIFLRIWVSSRDLNPEFLLKNNRSNEISNWLPVHMDNYLLKQDKKLIFLADKFYNLNTIFIIIIIFGYASGVIYLMNMKKFYKQDKTLNY
jgi:hypothetical protein